MFSIFFFAAGFATGLPERDRRMETLPAPAPCASGARGGCGASDWWRSPAPTEPPRDCPKGSSAATVRPGVWYCIPDRAIGE